MGGRDWARWAPLTGVIFAVLLFVGANVGGSTPDSDASAQHTVSYFTSHRGSQHASVFLIAYAVVFGLFFAAALRSYLPRPSRRRRSEHARLRGHDHPRRQCLL